MLGREATCMVDYSQNVLSTGNTPRGGKWFLINLQNTETRSGSTKKGADRPWWDMGLQQSDEEMLEVLYMELDPAANLARAKLLSMHVPSESAEEAAARAAAVAEAADSGEESGHVTNMYLYTATTDVTLVVEAVREAWREEPYEVDVPDYAWEQWRRAGDAALPMSLTQAAIQATVENTIYKWKQSPYLSGERLRVPDEVLHGDETETAIRLFNVDTGFYGL
jgi:hypothetical protein